jgi:hypothetical protein
VVTTAAVTTASPTTAAATTSTTGETHSTQDSSCLDDLVQITLRVENSWVQDGKRYSQMSVIIYNKSDRAMRR